MRVDIWSDVVCPWCYIGKRRFEAALAGLERRGEVEVVWHSFQLDPDAPREREGDRLEHLAAKYQVTRDEAAEMEARVVGTARDAGLEMRLDRARRGNTFDAHRLIHLGTDHGMGDAVKERLLQGYFIDGEPIGDPATLARLAVDAGLPADEVDAVLSTDRYADAVRADEAQARAFGITAVPFFVIGGAYGVAGAQPPDVLASVLERAWSDPNVSAVNTGPGDACADGACAV